MGPSSARPLRVAPALPHSVRREIPKSHNDNGVPIMKLFSAFGAADLLEKDRQTVRRALRRVVPDGFEGKNPRWRLPTIIPALDPHPRPTKTQPPPNPPLPHLSPNLPTTTP